MQPKIFLSFSSPTQKANQKKGFFYYQAFSISIPGYEWKVLLWSETFDSCR
jgi:hypothetical protein